MGHDPGSDVPALLREADKLYKSGLYDKALDLYDRALRMRQVPRIMCCKARCLAKAGQTDEALDLCRKAYDIAPLDPYMPYAAAEILSEAGRDEEAAAWYHITMRLEINDPGILAGLARFHSKSGDHGAAADFYMRACRIENDAALLYNTAKEFRYAGDLISAKRFCNVALDAPDRNPLVNDLANEISSKIGNPCGMMEKDSRLVCIPDTNWWIDHYGVFEGMRMTDSEMAADAASMINDIKSGRLRIFSAIRGEFRGKINGSCDMAGDYGSPYLSNVLTKFDSICEAGRIDERPIKVRRPDMYARTNLVYKEIWAFKYKAAISAKDLWARVKPEPWISKNDWDRMSRAAKDLRVSEGPPQDTKDHEILAEAASLEGTIGDRTVAVITRDNDFVPFKTWIWRRLGVCIRGSYDTKPK